MQFDNVFVGNNGVVKFCGVVIESLYHCVGNFGMYMGMGKSCMEYYAPQILKKQSFTNKAYSWSFGILLYEYI